MFVACTSMCFSRLPLEEAMTRMSVLRFNKLDVSIHEHGRHLKPSDVLADVSAAAATLKSCPGLSPCAFSLDMDDFESEDGVARFKAICRLARICAVPLITVRAADASVPIDDEAKRLSALVKTADLDGLLLCVPTLTGTHAQTPESAVALCEKVRGLWLTLDPSHFTAGPHQNKCCEEAIPYVRHVHMRDTGRGPNAFQVRVGQGEVEFGRIITQLSKSGYKRGVAVDFRDIPDGAFPVEPEVRKMKYLLESLV